MVDVQQLDGCSIIRVKEKILQMYCVPEFRTAVNAALEAKPAKVVFDLTEVDHIDSSALGAMLHFQRAIKGYNGRMLLAHVPERVMQVLKVTKTQGEVEIFESVNDALKA
jgi:anti-sigma B factor antagonist